MRNLRKPGSFGNTALNKNINSLDDVNIEAHLAKIEAFSAALARGEYAVC